MHVRPLIALALLWAISRPLLAVTSQSFQVSANVTPGCLVSGGVSHYGTLDFGSHPAVTTDTVNIALSGGLQLQCTSGVTLTLLVDGGQHNTSGRHLQLGTSANRVSYQLFRDVGLSQTLGIGQSVAVTYSDANNIRLPIYAQVQLPGDQPVGIYRDVLLVQLSW
ncbi:spore coat U domain-containing protein [Pseudomonas sp. NPDC086251]|uniref:Csu type fimbrial protein n=1 Tax=Pseudomonas sp. NPDC086251 TaxID=3364431 RepID=UPI0038371187